MNDNSNRSRMTAIMDALAEGDGRLFGEAMADDFVWHNPGSGPWSGSFRGKADVRGRLLKTLFAQFATPYRNRAERILADGEFTVVQCKGDVLTKTGKRYDNSYCYVIRWKDGLMRELVEYCDTALVDAALEPPGWP